MQKQRQYRNRRSFLKSAAIVAAGWFVNKTGQAEGQSSSMRPLFDGKTLDGWIQIQNSATSFSGNDIIDPAGLAKKLSDKSDPVSAFLSDLLDETGKTSLTTVATGTGDMKQARSGLAKNLTRIISATTTQGTPWRGVGSSEPAPPGRRIPPGTVENREQWVDRQGRSDGQYRLWPRSHLHRQ